MKSPRRAHKIRSLNGGNTLEEILQTDDVEAFKKLFETTSLNFGNIPRAETDVEPEQDPGKELLRIAVAFQAVKIVKFMLSEDVGVSDNIAEYFDSNEYKQWNGVISAKQLQLLALPQICAPSAKFWQSHTDQTAFVNQLAQLVANTNFDKRKQTQTDAVVASRLDAVFTSCGSLIRMQFRDNRGSISNMFSSAMETGSIDTIEFVLRHGADPNTFFGNLPRFALLRTRPLNVLVWLNDKYDEDEAESNLANKNIIAIAKLLVDFGVDTSFIAQNETSTLLRIAKEHKKRNIEGIFTPQYVGLSQKTQLNPDVERLIQSFVSPSFFLQRQREFVPQGKSLVPEAFLMERKRTREQMESMAKTIAQAAGALAVAKSNVGIEVSAKGAGAGNESVAKSNVGTKKEEKEEEEEDKENQTRQSKRPRK